MTAETDFDLYREGGIVLITPRTEGARAWAAEHVAEDAPRHGGAIVCEARFGAEIVRAALAAGLSVEGFGREH